MDGTDPFERWHQAWFLAPLELDFGITAPRPSFLRRITRRLRPSSLVPRPSTYHLQPLCLGHLIYLQALDSPLLKLDAEDVSFGIPDLLAVLRVLRDARWPFNAPLDFTPDACDELLLAAHTAAVAKGVQSPVQAVFESTFLPWWLACQTGPELLDDESGEGRSLSAPYALAMATRLLATGAFSEERVWSMPLALLRFYAAAVCEQDGGAAFLTPADVAAMKHAASLPDLTKSSDDELYAIAERERGKEFADAWLAERKRIRENAASIAAAGKEPTHA